MAEAKKTTEAAPKKANSKQIISNDKLMEAGSYFGHKSSNWNPKMKPYISSTKKGTHIINLQKTAAMLEFAYSIINRLAEKGANFIFVGTKKQAKDTIKENAVRTNSSYVSDRWLGGTITNSRTIFRRVNRMIELEKLQESDFAGYTKKEGVFFARELAKLQKNLNGIRNMRRRPNVMIVADPKGDEIAVKEARKAGIKIVGIVDTNVDPSLVDVAIPANDDSSKSIALIITVLADAIAKGKGGAELFAYKKDDEITLPEEVVIERKPRRRYGDRPSFRRTNYRRDSEERTENKSTDKKPAAKKAEESK